MSSKVSNSADLKEKPVQDARVHGVHEKEGLHDRGLKRELKSRHAQMITIGGVIGTGLFLGTASALARGGPGSLLLGYIFVSTVCVSVMISLGELVTFLPVPGGQMTLAGRFVDPALSFAMGWNYWYLGVITLPAELSAAAVLISFWNDTVNPAAWITICLAVVIFINFLGTRAYGESEFWFASIKVITIIGLIILGLVLDLGGGPNHDRLGFRYWHHPGAFSQFLGISGSKGRFLAFWSTLINAAFSFLGTEILGLIAAETHNPRKNVPRAIRGTYIRILLFYILGAFILGLICPSDNPRIAMPTGTVASSAWVVAIEIAGIKALPSIINACILTSVWSAGSSDLYVASRILFALANNGHAPKVLTKTNRHGTPWASLIVCSVFSPLAYMAVSSGSARVFGWFVNLATVSGLLNWMGICLTQIRFRQGLKAQGISLNVLPYRNHFQPYVAYWGLGWSLIIALFSNWQIFFHSQWDHTVFITSYFGFPFFLCLFLGYKIVKKSKLVPFTEMDFVTVAERVQ